MLAWFHDRAHVLGVLCVLLGLVACEPSVDTQGDDPDPQQDSELTDDEPGPAVAYFASEALGIGPTWYAYDLATHVLTPREEFYVVRFTESAFRVRLLSYYSAAGESGYFSLSVAAWESSAWGTDRTIEFDRSVKDETLCLDLEQVSLVPCSGTVDVVFRTDRRVLPGAGFSVAEPAMYFGAHRADGDVSVLRVPLSDGNTDPWILPVEMRATSAFVTPLEGVLAGLDSEHVVLHATSDFRICAWKREQFRVTDEALELELVSRCQPLSLEPEGQQTFDTVEESRVALMLPRAGDYEIAFLRLTEAGVIIERTEDAPPRGRWGDNRSFDLMVERSGDEALMLLGPGGVALVSRSATTALSIPASVWQ